MENREQEPSDYKLGIIYFNKADKRMWVPKRMGIGWTFNFANVWTYVTLIAIVCGLAYIKLMFINR